MTRRLGLVGLILVAATARGEDDPAKKMLKDLDGSYVPVSMISGGDRADDEFFKTVTFAIADGIVTAKFQVDGKPVERSFAMTVDPATKPAGFTLTPREEPDKGNTMLGIIKVEKDTVTLCWSDRFEKRERPADFVANTDNRFFLWVLKRAK